MIVIALTTNVATDAELTALVGMTDQDIVYHSGQQCAFMFHSNHSTGDLQADDLSGYWDKDLFIDCLDLLAYKHYRIDEINLRTSELIDGGYTWASKQFPLSTNGQINLLGMVNAAQLGILTFPIDLNTLDDEDRHPIADATEVYNIFGTALGTKKGYLDSGTALKDSIMAAVDELAVQAIIDNR
jgi:hypothetical protein